MNEEIAITFSWRFAAKAAWLYWKNVILSRRIIVLFVVISLAFILTWADGVNEHKNTLNGLIASSFVLILLWGSLVFAYVIILIRIIRQSKLILGRTTKCVLYNDRICIYSDHVVKEILWSDFNKFIKSSEVSIFYSSKRNKFIFFPNAMLSEKVQVFIFEKFNRTVSVSKNYRLKPPKIVSGSILNRNKLLAIILILLAAIAVFIWHYSFIPISSDILSNPSVTNSAL